MKSRTQQQKGLQVVASKSSADNQTRNRKRQMNAPMPGMEADIVKMARKTRDLLRTANNMKVAEKQINFVMSLYAVDLILSLRDGFGKPIITRAKEQPGEVFARVSRELQAMQVRLTEIAAELGPEIVQQWLAKAAA